MRVCNEKELLQQRINFPQIIQQFPISLINEFEYRKAQFRLWSYRIAKKNGTLFTISKDSIPDKWENTFVTELCFMNLLRQCCDHFCDLDECKILTIFDILGN